MLFDVLVLGMPLLLTFHGGWRGFRLSLLSLPIRILVSVLASWLAAAVIVLNMPSLGKAVADLLSVPAVTGLIVTGQVTFWLVLILLLVVLSKLRGWVLTSIAGHPIGRLERGFGVLSGIACGLVFIAVLIVLPYMYYQAIRPVGQPIGQRETTWQRESVSLPYIKGVADAIKAWLSARLPHERVSGE